jgi:hypothetical protein
MPRVAHSERKRVYTLRTKYGCITCKYFSPLVLHDSILVSTIDRFLEVRILAFYSSASGSLVLENQSGA